MAKIIAFCGTPCSGTTTVCLKAAQEVYLKTQNGAVIYVNPSLKIPALGLLFPNYTPDSLFSLGSMFDTTDIYEEDVLNHLVTVKNMQNFGCLGYKSGENKNSYAHLTIDKVEGLFKTLKEMAGYVFVDCTNDEDDLISKYAMSIADMVVMVISPTLKSMTYLSSNKESFGSNFEKIIKVLNTTDDDLFYPTEDVKGLVKDVYAVLPFCKAVKGQQLDGLLYTLIKDKKFLKELRKLTQILM